MENVADSGPCLERLRSFCTVRLGIQGQEDRRNEPNGSEDSADAIYGRSLGVSKHVEGCEVDAGGLGVCFAPFVEALYD